MTLTQDPAMANSAEAVDLQLLVVSYIDILKNSATAPVQANAPVVVGTFAAPAPIASGSSSVIATSPASSTRTAVLPASATTSMATTPATVVTSSPASAAPASATPAATMPAAGSPAATTVRPPALAIRQVVPAATIRQNLPAFTTPGTARPMSGAVRVTIGADGKVTDAVMEVPIEPRYDAKVLGAARNWLYKPATLGGAPIQSEKVVHINIGQ